MTPPRPESWRLSRWVIFRDQQLAELAEAKKHGDFTEILEATIHLAESQIATRTFTTPEGDRWEVLADRWDLEAAG